MSEEKVEMKCKLCGKDIVVGYWIHNKETGKTSHACKDCYEKLKEAER